MGIIVFLGECIGSKNRGRYSCWKWCCYIFNFSYCYNFLVVPFSDKLYTFMHAPIESFEQTKQYVQICGMSMIFIMLYNIIGSVFRGIGDSKTPLMIVTIACIINILGDFILVAGFRMGAIGAAIATVFAQAISVIFSIYFIIKKKFPFDFSKKNICFDSECVKMILLIGMPIALQELLVQFSFLFIQVVVNRMGVIESAAVGVAEKVCVFLMLVASAYMQSISVFVAQNNGAGEFERSRKALIYRIKTALIIGFIMGIISFFGGNILSSIFSGEYQVTIHAHDYLKAYSIDCLLTAVLFCFVGYFNGCGKTIFVIIQGIIGAFFVRIPVVFIMSQINGATLFHIGLGTPISSLVQIILCVIAYFIYKKRYESIEYGIYN